MKRFFIFIFFINFILSNIVISQTTYIPDDNFEQYLISLGLDNAPLDDTVLTSAIDTVETLQLGFKYL